MPSASGHHQIPAETQRHDDDQTQETAQGLSAAAMLAQEQADDLDAIETVLETNAEEYVSSFVQKGGE